MLASAIFIFIGLAVTFGLLLGFAAIRYKVEDNPVVELIDKELPQTQCGQCNYPGCKPYAEAVASGEAEVNQCIPGGTDVMIKIAEITHRDQLPMDATNDDKPKGKIIALIDEEACIGCLHCIKACPVDAIVGSIKQMHTVISKECTGCDLCAPACPVDCIDMIPVKETAQTWGWNEPETKPTPTPVDIYLGGFNEMTHAK
jgi:electron transport complex protein RnfB